MKWKLNLCQCQVDKKIIDAFIISRILLGEAESEVLIDRNSREVAEKNERYGGAYQKGNGRW